jgi:hypothetical protein
LAPTSPERSLQPANATVAARIAIIVVIRILDPFNSLALASSLSPETAALSGAAS